MATLNQQIESILSGDNSVSVITRSLKGLGLAQREIDILLSSYNKNTVENITFGVEIECFNVRREEIAQRLCEAGVACYVEGYNHRDYRDHFKVVTDASLAGNDTAEVVSPILKGKAGMQTLEKVCKVLNEINAMVNKSCGLHVHFGLNDVNFSAYRNIFINYARLENVIDSFMPKSRRNNGYCKGFRSFGNNIYELLSCAGSKEDIASIFERDRYYKVNPVAFVRHNTIEFRQHSGTVDFVKMANWIKFLKGLIAFSKKSVLRENVANINDIPFINAELRQYYQQRQVALA